MSLFIYLGQYLKDNFENASADKINKTKLPICFINSLDFVEIIDFN